MSEHGGINAVRSALREFYPSLEEQDAWLNGPHPLLRGQAAIDLIGTPYEFEVWALIDQLALRSGGMTSFESQPRTVTRESLAAALHEAQIGCWGPEPVHAPPDPDALIGCNLRWNGTTPSMHDEQADAILAALPSPAPEPPPLQWKDVLQPAADRDRLQCGWCGDRLLPSEIEGHLNSEGRSAAQPAPDPEAIRLLTALVEAIENPEGPLNISQKIADAKVEARSFLHARSGRSQEEASEVRSE